MYKTKLISLLSGLSPEEWKSLGLFLKSPYYNSNKKIISLYVFLSKYYPSFNSPKLAQEEVLKKIFPESTSKAPKQFANIMSQFINLTKDFFTIRRLKEKPHLQQQLLGEYFSEQKKYGWYKRNTSLILKKIQASKSKNETDYFQAYTINKSFYENPETIKTLENAPYLFDAANNLFHFFSLEYLKLSVQIISRQHFHNEVGYALDYKLIHQLSLSPLGPIHEFYTHLFSLFEYFNEQQFDNTQSLFFDNLDQFPKNDQINIFALLLNLKHRYYKNKSKDLQKKPLFEFYRKGIENHLLIENNILIVNHFLNIVTLAALSNEITWARAFIDEYQSYLIDKDKENIIIFCKARLLFEEKAYLIVSDLLLELKRESASITLNAQVLYLKSLYELFLKDQSYSDLLISRIHASDKLIRRNKVWNDKMKLGYINFNKTLLKIIKNHFIKDKALSKRITDELNAQPVSSKSWLLEKINLL